MNNPFSVQYPKPWKLEWYQSEKKTWLLRSVTVEPEFTPGGLFTAMANANNGRVLSDPITLADLEKMVEKFATPVRRDGWMRTFLPREFMVESFTTPPIHAPVTPSALTQAFDAVDAVERKKK